MTSTDTSTLRVLVWGENRHEQVEQHVRDIYPDGMHTTIAEGIAENLGDAASVVDHHPGRARARADRGGAGRHRRAGLVGSRRARRGGRRGGRAGAPARAVRHGSAGAALGALVEDLRQADGHDLHPALAQRAGSRAGLDGEPDPPDRPGRPEPDHHPRPGDVRRVLRHPRPRRAGLHLLVHRRRGVPLRLHLPARPRQDLLLLPRRPGLPGLPPQGRAQGDRQRRAVGEQRAARSGPCRPCCATTPTTSSTVTATPVRSRTTAPTTPPTSDAG